MTFAELEQLPDAPGKEELIDGELISLPPHRFSHSCIAKGLYGVLAETAHADRTFVEAGYRIAEGWLQPEVSVTWPNQEVDPDYLVGSPMLAIEILSPEKMAWDLERKLTLYLAEGGGEVWVVDPKRKIISVYRKVAEQVIRTVVESTYHSDLVGVTVDLASVFE